MNKAIIIIFLILRTIMTPFCNLAGRGTKTVEIGKRAQLGFTGIYITVLDYKRVYPSIEEKDSEPKKYIAFEVLLDGSKERSGGDPAQHFGCPVGEFNCHGERYNIYYMCGFFYVEGEFNSKVYGIMMNEDSVCLFGKELPILGVGKSKEKIDIASGLVIFELPENFEINKFIYCYHEHSDLTKMLFPEAKVQIIFENPIK
ncbi:MAG: hypothetical protein GW803_06685 [Caldiserica bacterium]|nr:hypothetical protein [Caldisericota bacterium]PIW10988.1 MAG: hypothetical protein COW37_01055 [Caldiserica bacterium CG17_big_fil_post_rev_8_21_14_2_50_35_7]